ncbi:MAG: Ig-like domain-containing protein [Eubacterium sp.]|nr:Ig-like domain-containing protein [Eubacterium sp.]
MKWMGKRTLAVLMAGALAIGSLATGTSEVSAAKKVSISKKSLTLVVGQTANLKLKNTAKKAAKKAKWVSSNKKVVTVSFKKSSAKATVSAVSAGKANVTAKLNKKSYTCKVTVKAAAQNLMMLRDNFATYVGSAVGVRPVVVGEGELDMSQLKYKSSAPSVAKVVGKEGAVVGVKAGSATITITNPDGKKLEATVHVYNSVADATYANDFYTKNMQDKLNELKQAGIEVKDGQQFVGIEKHFDDKVVMVRTFSDEYLNAVKNNGGKSVYTDNTPADDIACIRSVFDMDEVTKRSTLVKDLKTYLEPLDNAKTAEDVLKFNARITENGEAGFWESNYDAFGADVAIIGVAAKTLVIKPELRAASMLNRKSDFTKKDSELYKSLVRLVEETLRVSGESEEEIAKNTPVVIDLMEKCSTELSMTELQAQLVGKTQEEIMEFLRENNIDMDSLGGTVGQIDEGFPDLMMGSIYQSAGFGKDVMIMSEQLKTSWVELLELIKNGKVAELKELLRFCYAYNYVKYTETGFKAYKTYKAHKDGMLNPPSDEEMSKDYKNQVINVLCDEIGWDTVKEYAPKVLGDKSKQELQNIIDRVLAEYKTTFTECPWMSETAKAGALKKIEKMKSTVYYPEFDAFDLKNDLQTAGEGGSLFKNMQQIRNSEIKGLASLSGRKMNTDEMMWFINRKMGGNPMTANADYVAAANQFVILAGIIGEESYKAGDDDYNLGRIGYVIGHEIGHAFDSDGSNFDENGDFNAWMTDSDLAAFEAKKAVYVKYYDQLSVFYDKTNETIYYANGSFELPENMADISSIQIITQMLKKAGADKEKIKKVFINMGLFWANSEQFDPSNLITDNHGPDMLRGGYTFSIFDEFYDAFDIKEGDAMYVVPEYRVKLWS